MENQKTAADTNNTISEQDVKNITDILKEQIKISKKINEDRFTVFLAVIVMLVISICLSVTGVLFAYLGNH